MTQSQDATLIVLTPELLGLSFFERRCCEVLKMWRDGKVKPVVNPTLAVRYLRLLRKLGLTRERHLRWWTWWLTSPQKAKYLPEPALDTLSTYDLLERVREEGNAVAIVMSERFQGAETDRHSHWVRASRLGKLLG